MNVHEFTSIFGSTGFAKASHFELQVVGPIQGIGISDVSSVIPFRCQAVDIPGRLLTTSEYTTYGPVQKIATGQSFDDVNATIVLSDAMDEKLFFERWQDFACGFARGMDGVGAGMFDVGYYSEYIGTVIIRQFSEHGDIVYEALLLEAYPIQISSLNADWNSDEPHRLTVQFAYRYFTDDPGWRDAVDVAFAGQVAEIATALGLADGTGAGSSDIGIDPGADVGPSGSGAGAPGETETVIITPETG